MTQAVKRKIKKLKPGWIYRVGRKDVKERLEICAHTGALWLRVGTLPDILKSLKKLPPVALMGIDGGLFLRTDDVIKWIPKVSTLVKLLSERFDIEV